MSRCQVATELDAEEGPVACGAAAPYVALDWGYGPRSDETSCCEPHARAARSDGARVIGPDGDDVDFDLEDAS